MIRSTYANVSLDSSFCLKGMLHVLYHSWIRKVYHVDDKYTPSPPHAHA